MIAMMGRRGDAVIDGRRWGTARWVPAWSAVLGCAVALSACSVAAVTFTPSDDQASDAGAADGRVTSDPPADTPVPGAGMATLTVRQSGDGSGTVSSQGAPIACGAQCSVTVEVGTQITLTAEAAVGTVFGGWTGGGCDGSATHCTVTVTADVAVGAQFDLATFTVEVALTGSGAGMVMSSLGIVCPGMCKRALPYNSTVELVAGATGSSVFTGWGGACSGAGACSFTVTGDVVVMADFTATRNLTVTRTGSGIGSVSSNPAGIQCGTDCTHSYLSGTSVTLTATANGDSIFAGWSGAGCSGTAPCAVTLSQAATVTARFEAPGRGLFVINQVTDRLERMDPVSFALTDIGPLGIDYSVGDCAWNPSDATLYMVDGATNAKGLYRVNLTTGAATLVGVHGVTNLLAIAYHPPTNQFYAVALEAGNNLYRINPATGAATLVGPTNVQQVEGLAWDSKRNVMMALSFVTATLYTLDLSTGAPTTVTSQQLLGQLGMTYDAVRDRFWIADTNTGILQLDPNNGFARSTIATLGENLTCIAFVP